MRIPFAFLMTVSLLALAGCGGSSSSSPSSPSGTAGTSTTGRTSHNAGRDCTSCHGFTVSGTVYRADGVTANPGATVRVTSAAVNGGTVAATLTADASGNFYTSTAVGFGTGLFTSVVGAAGTVRSMSGVVTNGACNRCHTTGSRIVVD